APVGLKLNRCIEADPRRVVSFAGEAFDPAQEDLADPPFSRLFSPDGRRSRGIGQLVGSVNQKQRLAADSDIPLVPEGIDEPADVLLVVVLTILLRDQNLFVVPVPPPAPVLVRPAQAEGEVRLARRQDLGKGALEEAFALKPIMVVTEPVNAVFPGQV